MLICGRYAYSYMRSASHLHSYYALIFACAGQICASGGSSRTGPRGASCFAAFLFCRLRRVPSGGGCYSIYKGVCHPLDPRPSQGRIASRYSFLSVAMTSDVPCSCQDILAVRMRSRIYNILLCVWSTLVPRVSLTLVINSFLHVRSSHVVS